MPPIPSEPAKIPMAIKSISIGIPAFAKNFANRILMINKIATIRRM